MRKEAHWPLAVLPQAAHLGAEAARVQPQLEMAVCILAAGAKRAFLQVDKQYTWQAGRQASWVVFGSYSL